MGLRCSQFFYNGANYEFINMIFSFPMNDASYLRNFGIFIEPGIHYYFNDGSYLNTIRKDHPVNFTLPMGIRWTY